MLLNIQEYNLALVVSMQIYIMDRSATSLNKIKAKSIGVNSRSISFSIKNMLIIIDFILMHFNFFHTIIVRVIVTSVVA